MQSFEDAERSKLLGQVLWVTAALALFGFGTTFLDPRNLLSVSVAFYGTILGLVAALFFAVRRGHESVVVWGVSGGLWLVIALVTVLFGGLRGNNASTFIVVALMLGTFGKGNIGIVAAVVSAAWCAMIAWLELTGRLPEPLGAGYSPINSWAAVTIDLLLTALLVRASMRSMRRASERAAEHATERDLALRRSIEAQKMEAIGRLASGVAHDFNNLLMVIGGSAESLRTAGGADREDLLRELEEAAGRAALMTRHLVSLGRPHAGTPVLLDLARVVTTFSPLLPRLVGPNVAVQTLAFEPAWILATEAGIEQVLLNLVVNAREAMPAGGRLVIAVEADRAEVRLVVSDTGVGMDAATKEAMFAPFFTTKATGTGLGLATVADRVQQFGGSIGVESEVGRGATFTLRFPRELPAHGRVAQVLPHTSGDVHSERLLVVEDDPRVRRGVARMLEESGYDVIAVSNGDEALRLLAGPHAFRCVVSDVSMPLVDGEALGERLPDLPMVWMSGDRELRVTSPLRVFLDKPFTRDALVAAVEDVIAEARAPQRRARV